MALSYFLLNSTSCCLELISSLMVSEYNLSNFFDDNVPSHQSTKDGAEH